jgi:colanic acid biosynthesis glycosyl transferase WcaI
VASKDRILVLAQFFRPEPNFITGDVADVLSSIAPVTVITGVPNYPEGKFMDGYRPWWPTRESRGDVVVWRLPYFPDRSYSTVRRMLCYLSFTVVAWSAVVFLGWRSRIVWVYQTPPTLGLVAAWVRLTTGARAVYTYADLWPESFVASGVNKSRLAASLLRGMRRFVNRFADIVVCSTRGTLETLTAEGVKAALVHIPVWVGGIPLHVEEPVTADDGAARIVYAGNVGACQDLECIVLAAGLLEARGRPVTFDIYGTGAELPRLKALAAERGIHSVAFHGRVSADVAFRASAGAVGQIVTLQLGPMFRRTVPSKLAFCFAAGAPVLYSMEGEAADIARASGGAIAFDARRPDTLVAAVDELLALCAADRARIRTAMRSYYREHFDSATLQARYADVARALWTSIDLPSGGGADVSQLRRQRV